jgi:hypothetical protein
MRRIEHNDDDDGGLQNPDEFLDRAHPENDHYMKAVEHVQRQLMAQTQQLRPKQVNMLKTIFSGQNYAQTAKTHQAAPQTVSRLVKSPNGQKLLNLLQYHLKLIEGPNEAQRRNMLWRIAVKEENAKTTTSIKAIAELNKMHFQVQEAQTVQVQTVIHINQELMPKTQLDR